MKAKETKINLDKTLEDIDAQIALLNQKSYSKNFEEAQKQKTVYQDESLPKTGKSHNIQDKASIFEKIRNYFKTSQVLLVNFELRNGNHRSFTIIDKQGEFRFLKCLYIIDQSLKYYNIDSKMWCLDYHQDYSLPVKRIIRVELIKKAIEDSNIIEAEASTNPSLIDTYVDAFTQGSTPH